MTDAELVRDALDEFMPCYGSEESAKRKREVLAAFDGIVARVAELEEGIKAAIREAPHWRNPSPLSHYLPADAARKLGITRQAIKERMDRGTVPVETHEGRRWIPAWWIADQLEAKVEEP